MLTILNESTNYSPHLLMSMPRINHVCIEVSSSFFLFYEYTFTNTFSSALFFQLMNVIIITLILPSLQLLYLTRHMIITSLHRKVLFHSDEKTPTVWKLYKKNYSVKSTLYENKIYLQVSCSPEKSVNLISRGWRRRSVWREKHSSGTTRLPALEAPALHWLHSTNVIFIK